MPSPSFLKAGTMYDQIYGDFVTQEALNTTLTKGKALGAKRVATEKSSMLVFVTSQTGISASGDSGDLVGWGRLERLMLLGNLTALTGTSVQFKIQTKDEYGNYYSIATGTALTTPGTSVLNVGAGMGTNADFGPIIRVQWVLVAASGVSFTITVRGK